MKNLIASLLLLPLIASAAPLDEANLKRMCTQLADPSTRSSVLNNMKTIQDINNDGVDDIGEECYGGTMHVPCREYKDKSGKPLRITQMGFEWKDYWTYGASVFSYDDRTFTLNTYDDNLNEPAYVSFVTPQNEEFVVCEFANNKSWTDKPSKYGMRFKNICQNSTKLEALPFDHLEEPQAEKIEKYPVDQGGISGIAKIDYDNDGRSNTLVSFEVASGAGRGCDYTFYLELKEDGVSLFQPSDRPFDSLTKGVTCGSNNEFFIVNGKVFFRITSDDLHEIRLADHDKVMTICEYEKKIDSSVTSVKLPNNYKQRDCHTLRVCQPLL